LDENNRSRERHPKRIGFPPVLLESLEYKSCTKQNKVKKKILP
jgi:hypothetical protein